ncbi:MAG TPA: citrate synthase, partial [Polyangiaceae bacterium]|nr:citrate synthase [Polyangiaceae bacterium]
FIDGDLGILRHRGYPIEQLAEKCTYLDVAYLLMNGELPSPSELSAFAAEITAESSLPENMKTLIGAFPKNAHPMGMLISAMGALGTFNPDSKEVLDAKVRRKHVARIIAQIPIIAAWSYRHGAGKPFVMPDPSLGYTANFLSMMKRGNEARYDAHADIVKALDVLFILHADHEQNCSTNTMRAIGSSHADPYSAVAGAAAALYGPLHGGANEAVLHMLNEIGRMEAVPQFIKDIKGGSSGQRLMGFGHRVYKNYDPRAKVIKSLADRVFDILGKQNPLLQIARELERIALQDEYFVKRKLYPNVDFYSGLIYQALEIPIDLFPVMFAIPRASGWLAQWEEMLMDKEQKIARPRQIYTGITVRDVKR